MRKTKVAKKILVLFVVLTANIEAYSRIMQPTIRWLVITIICLIGIIVAAIYLEEQPLEFWDNFTYYKGNEVSVILIAASFISCTAALISWIN